MTNGAMNVEIGNPTYKMYEGGEPDDVGGLLDADFALDPDKVCLQPSRGLLEQGPRAGDDQSRVLRKSGSWGILIIRTFIIFFSAYQFHQPSVCYTLHGGPRQPPLPGQHGREAGTAGPGT